MFLQRDFHQKVLIARGSGSVVGVAGLQQRNNGWNWKQNQGIVYLHVLSRLWLLFGDIIQLFSFTGYTGRGQ